MDLNQNVLQGNKKSFEYVHWDVKIVEFHLKHWKFHDPLHATHTVAERMVHTPRFLDLRFGLYSPKY